MLTGERRTAVKKRTPITNRAVTKRTAGKWRTSMPRAGGAGQQSGAPNQMKLDGRVTAVHIER